MGHEHLYPGSVGRLLPSFRSPRQNQMSKPLSRRTREAEGSNVFFIRLALHRELSRHIRPGLGVFLHEPKELVASDEVDLRRFQRLRSALEIVPCHNTGQTEELTGLGDPDDQGLSVARRDGELCFAVAKHEDTAGRLTFSEKESAGRIDVRKRKRIERLPRLRRQTAEESFTPQFAV